MSLSNDSRLSCEQIRFFLADFDHQIELLDEILTNALMEIQGAGIIVDPKKARDAGYLMVDMYRARLRQIVEEFKEDLIG